MLLETLPKVADRFVAGTLSIVPLETPSFVLDKGGDRVVFQCYWHLRAENSHPKISQHVNYFVATETISYQVLHHYFAVESLASTQLRTLHQHDSLEVVEGWNWEGYCEQSFELTFLILERRSRGSWSLISLERVFVMEGLHAMTMALTMLAWFGPNRLRYDAHLVL